MNFNYQNINFDVLSTHCFEPNLTTKIFADAVLEKLNRENKQSSILELGCGTGILTIILNHFFQNRYHLSDIDEQAVKTAQLNLMKYSVDAKLIKSDGIESWGDNQFDLIINDVSGISENLAKISTWFQNAPADTGRSGVELTEKILLSAKKNLKNQDSEIFFPVISLSNTERLLSFACRHYKSVEKKASQSWPLPKDLENYKDLLSSLKTTKDINFEEKFGMIICNTSVYSAKDPIHEEHKKSL